MMGMPKCRKTTFTVAAAIMLNCRKLLLWSRDLSFHAILHPLSNFHARGLTWRQDTKNDFQYGGRPPS